MSVKEVRLEMISLQEKSQIIGLHIKGKSNRKIAKELGLSRDTVNKYVAEYDKLQSELLAADPDDGEAVRDATERIVAEPKYDSSKRRARKWTPAMDLRLDEILAAEAYKRKVLGWDKQMMTRRQIHAQMRAEGFDIGLTTVQNKVREKLEGSKEAYIAQEYAYGDRFEYDFGEVHLVIAGTMRKLYMAVMAMPASGGRFALLYESQGKDVFEDSQVRFFEHVGGCFREGVYDNMRNVVKRFIGPSEKELNEDLLKLAAYYGFAVNVTNCYAGNEKGTVESAVKALRREAFATAWEFGSVAEAQAHLDAVLAELNAATEMGAEMAALTPRRPPYETADVRTGASVNKYSCVAYDNAQYSVPDGLVGKKVDVKAYPAEIRIVYRDREVARHERTYEKGGMRLDIHHYVRTFRRKPGALANSAVLRADARLKGVFDMHYSRNPREFVDVVAANPGAGPGELADVLVAHATCEETPASREAAGRIAACTAAQVGRMAALGREVRRAS